MSPALPAESSTQPDIKVPLAMTADSRKPLVLIAEDHSDTRAMLRMLLTLNGYDVAESADGEAAVAAVASLRPDVILLDYTLPKLDGVGVARRVKSAGDGVERHIVFLSGYAGTDVQQQAQDAGCDSFLVKPVDLEALLRIIRRITAAGGH